MSESEKHALGALAVVLFVVLLAAADGIITGMTGGGLVR